MSVCPYCGYEGNIAGADVCDECESPLDDLSRPKPGSPIERSILKDRIFVLQPRKPLVVSPDTPVEEVLQLLVKHFVGCVLVVQNEELVGIFSERDALIRLNTEAEELGCEPISKFMTPNPQTLEANDKIAYALHRMDLGGYRHIPILTDGKVTGIISIRDILRYITDHILESV